MLLHNELNTLQQNLGITIYQPDIEALFENVMANPAAYGFTNVTDALLYSSDPTTTPGLPVLGHGPSHDGRRSDHW